MKVIRVALLTTDKTYQKTIREALEKEGLIVDVYSSSTECENNNKYADYALFIIDTLLEGYNGYIFTEYLRQRVNTPIIMISKEYEEADVIRGLTAGADEMLKIPLRLREFVVRCICLIRKYQTQIPSKVIKINGILFDRRKNQAFDDAGNLLSLTPTELKLLRVLMTKAGEEISARELLESVWGWDDGNVAIVSTNINRLRQKIGKEKITTIKGRGYRYEIM